MSPSPVLACFRMSEKGGKKVPFFTLVHPERSPCEDGRPESPEYPCLKVKLCQNVTLSEVEGSRVVKTGVVK